MDAFVSSSSMLRLQFPPEVESRFREDYHEKTLSTSRLAILMELLLIAAFGFLDKTTAPQSYLFIWMIRYRIVVPILGLILLLTFFPRLKAWMQLVVASAVFTSTLGITVMGAVTRPGEAAFSTYYVGILLALMAGYTFHFTIAAEEATLPALKVSRGYVAELTGKKILLVDDYETNLQILQLQTEA